MKKLLTLTLSLLMVFSLCLTVSAEDISSGEYLESYLEAQEELFIDYGKADPVIIDLQDDINIENLSAKYFDITVNLNGKALNISGSITINGGKKITINDNKGGGVVNIGDDITPYEGTFEVTGGTYNIDVADYLGFGCSIVRSRTSENYTVYNAQYAVPTVSEGAIAVLSDEAESTLGGLQVIKKVNDGEPHPDFEIPTDATVKYAFTSKIEGYYPEELKEPIIEVLKSEISDIENTDLAKATNLDIVQLDIILKAKINEHDYEVRNLGNTEIPVTLHLSESDAAKLKAASYIGVIRYHTEDDAEDEYTLMENNAVKLEDNVLTFNSSKFSTYFIVYGTSSSSGSSSSSSSSTTTATTTTPTKTYDPKDKNKDGVVSCEEEMNSANWVWSTTKGACVYSVTNTSAK